MDKFLIYSKNHKHFPLRYHYLNELRPQEIAPSRRLYVDIDTCRY